MCYLPPPSCALILPSIAHIALRHVPSRSHRTAARFDVCCLDLNMPRLDGLGAARAIAAHARERALWCPPIVALCANRAAEDKANCLAAGMAEHLVRGGASGC